MNGQRTARNWNARREVALKTMNARLDNLKNGRIQVPDVTPEQSAEFIKQWIAQLEVVIKNTEKNMGKGLTAMRNSRKATL